MDATKERIIQEIEEKISYFEEAARKSGVTIYDLRKEWEGYHKPQYLAGSVDDNYIQGLKDRLNKHDIFSLMKMRYEHLEMGAIFYTGYTKG